MKLSKSVWLLVLLITLALLLSGCLNNSTTSDSSTADEAATGTVNSDLNVEIPDGKTDRLPGSLKWDSVVTYTAGIDFFNDQPDGLHTQATSAGAKTSVTIESSTTADGDTTQTTETAVTAEGDNQGSGGSTTSIQSSGGGVTTDVTVDGSMTVTESTTSGSGGSQSTTNWWEIGE